MTPSRTRVTIDFGEGVPWDTLVAQSTVSKRSVPLDLKLGPTTEEEAVLIGTTHRRRHYRRRRPALLRAVLDVWEDIGQ
jgi:hypothetical protein